MENYGLLDSYKALNGGSLISTTKKTLKTLKEEEGNIFEKGLIKTKDEK